MLPKQSLVEFSLILGTDLSGLGSGAMSQLAFPENDDPNLPWKIIILVTTIIV